MYEPDSPLSDDDPSIVVIEHPNQLPLVRPAGPQETRGREYDGSDVDFFPEESDLDPSQDFPPPPSQRQPLGRFGVHRQGEMATGSQEPRFGKSESCMKENLPPPAANEIEFLVKDPLSYQPGVSVRSDGRTVGNFRFRILMFPGGTSSSGGNQVSGFVEACPENLDPRWIFVGVSYQLALINWLDYRRTIIKSDTWTFTREGIDRGWHDLIRASELTVESGWLSPANELCLRASCYVKQADGLNVTSDTCLEKETGYIGLKNHGATCYMNGLLQSLFHVGEFRRIVYSINCDEADREVRKADEDKAPSLIQALQNVFYRMQTSDTAVNCRELMKSFGWDTTDAFTQHDAQELNRILCDRLEERMKNTSMDGSIKRLFEGQMENYIECIDVDYKSKRTETFYDIQLNIKGERGQELKTIEESLRDFTTEETLEGDNLYEAEGHGKQRAKKGIRFLRFPPVLNLQLKRFHFDLEKMDMVKLNSRFEFHRRLNLEDFVPNGGTYILYAVVVHSGDVNSGHYYAHIKPDLEKGWFKFDDDTVTPCSDYAAVEDNYGGSDLQVWNYFDRSPRRLRSSPAPTRARIHNAYMLVYIREDVAAQILTPPDPKVVNPQMVDRCNEEVTLLEERRLQKLEQQSRIRIKLVFERDLCTMKGFWDEQDVQHLSTHGTKMARDQLVKELLLEVESLTEVPQIHMALYTLQYRAQSRQVRFAYMNPKNHLRVHIPQYNAPHFDVADPFLVVLCLVSRGYEIETLTWMPTFEDQRPTELFSWDENKAMMFIVKYFCAQTRKVVTLGCYYLNISDSIQIMMTTGWVLDRLKPYTASKEVAPLPVDAETRLWQCWEEFSDRDIQLRSTKRTVQQEQLWVGDVIIWQLSAEATEAQEIGDEIAPTYPVNTVQDLAGYLANTIDVSVILHDSSQPLCVDGMVANGNWSPVRPSSAVPKVADGAPQREERPEEAQLALSPSKFRSPQEREIKMDLRWQLHHVTATIAKAFDLAVPPKEAQLWLFHAPPSSTAEEPLNTNVNRADPGTLKELQRAALYLSPNSKRQLTLHAVELAWQPGREAVNKGLCPFCIRFYDEAVREVGSQIITVSNDSLIADVIAESRKHIRPEWGMSGPLRVLEVHDGRLYMIYRPDHPVRTLGCFTKTNIFFYSLRVEVDTPVPENHSLQEIFHCDRQSQQAFAQPFLLSLAPHERSGNIKALCKAKLQVPDSEFKSWRLVRSSRTSKVHLKDDDPWDADSTLDTKLCLEHVHPNPTNSRQSRANKPLTIKA